MTVAQQHPQIAQPPAQTPITAQPPPYVKWIIGVVSTLLTAGIIAQLSMSISNREDLARISEQLAHIKEDQEEVSDEIKTAQVNVRALEIVVARFNVNHDAIREELADMKTRLRALEQEERERK